MSLIPEQVKTILKINLEDYYQTSDLPHVIDKNINQHLRLLTISHDQMRYLCHSPLHLHSILADTDISATATGKSVWLLLWSRTYILCHY